MAWFGKGSVAWFGKGSGLVWYVFINRLSVVAILCVANEGKSQKPIAGCSCYSSSSRRKSFRIKVFFLSEVQSREGECRTTDGVKRVHVLGQTWRIRRDG